MTANLTWSKGKLQRHYQEFFFRLSNVSQGNFQGENRGECPIPAMLSARRSAADATGTRRLPHIASQIEFDHRPIMRFLSIRSPSTAVGN